jgi:hypothetical protein
LRERERFGWSGHTTKIKGKKELIRITKTHGSAPVEDEKDDEDDDAVDRRDCTDCSD